MRIYWMTNWLHCAIAICTRKLTYRKDDHAMHPVYECPKILGLPRYLSQIFMGFCSDQLYVRRKFEMRSFTRSWDNTGVAKKNSGSPWLCPHSPHSLSQKNSRPSIQTIPLCALVLPQFSIGVLGGVCEPRSNLGKGDMGAVGRESGMVPSERVLVSSYSSLLFLYQHSFARNFTVQFWLGVANPQSRGRGGLMVGMVGLPFEECWWVPIHRP